jgi:hypothetical protein
LFFFNFKKKNQFFFPSDLVSPSIPATSRNFFTVSVSGNVHISNRVRL